MNQRNKDRKNTTDTDNRIDNTGGSKKTKKVTKTRRRHTKMLEDVSPGVYHNKIRGHDADTSVANTTVNSSHILPTSL